jgi:hypothetical protein
LIGADPSGSSRELAEMIRERLQGIEYLPYPDFVRRALAALIIGALVLLFGIYLVFSQIRFFGPPFSYIAILVIGLILIGVGAKLVTNRAR